MELDPIVLARIQFAINISFHILFPSINIALAWILLFFKLRYEKTNNGLRYRDYYQENKRNILRQVSSKEFNKIYFLNLDYRDTTSPVLLCSINTDIVMYCDPPYQNSKKYDISKNFDYDEFCSSLITLDEAIKNVTIFVSE